MKFFELSDSRYLGMDIIKIASFPNILAYGQNKKENCEKLYQSFVQLVTELHHLCGINTCIEFLWLTETTENQTFISKIQIYIILRKISDDKSRIQIQLENVKQNIIATLSALQYNLDIEDTAYTEAMDLLREIDCSCAYSVVKSEKCIANVNSVYPYYYTDVVANKNYDNFNALISTLSQSKHCCLSFQLFPVTLTAQENLIINEVTAELWQISNGTLLNGKMYRDALAQKPLAMYTYYNERRNSPIFMYNIIAFGSRSNCANMATKIISLLQSGEDKIVTSDYMCIDLSEEKIDLSKHFSYYVWNVNNQLLYRYRNQKIQQAIPVANQLFRLPYIMSAEETASFMRLPLFETSMPAIKNNQLIQIKEQFSSHVVNKDNFILGKLVTNDSSNIPIGCSGKDFTKHAVIVGMPGSGKTTFSVNLLLQFYRKGIPFLAIEPTKSEYRAMIDAIPGLQIFTPGNNAVSPFIINPFIPPKGIQIEQFIPSLASAFKAAFSMPSPLDMIFLKAIRTCYTQYGWKDYSMIGDPDVQEFGLFEFIKVFKRLLDNTTYSNEVRGNLQSAGILRLTNLIEQNSNIYDTINTIPIEDILTAPTVIELNSIDNAEQKSLIMALLLINICLYTKHNQKGDGELKNSILIDEAHVLLGGGASNLKLDGNPDSQSTTVKAIQDMIVEIRSYGSSIIIADQSPTKIGREIIANTDIKVAFRLVQSLEKELIADSSNMDEEMCNGLSRLKPGEAYVYYSHLETPQMILTEDIRKKENIRLSVSDEEIANKSRYWDNHLHLLKPYNECRYCKHCKKTCDNKIRANAAYIANKVFEKYRGSINTKEYLRKLIFHLPKLMHDDFLPYSENDSLEKIQLCSRIQLYRKVSLELPLELLEEEKALTFTLNPGK